MQDERQHSLQEDGIAVGLKDMLHSIREYPAAAANLKTVTQELEQTRQALKQSDENCQKLDSIEWTQAHQLKSAQQKSIALLAVLTEFCPKLSSVEDMKRLYDTASPSMDPNGFTLYRTAQKMTGINIHNVFAYEERQGLFAGADAHLQMQYLVASHFDAVEWTAVSGTCYESAALQEVNTASPEYRAFEKQLYRKALTRMGFRDMLVPEQDRKQEQVKNLPKSRGKRDNAR